MTNLRQALIVSLLTLSFSAMAAKSFDLRGSWYRTEDYGFEAPIEFVLIKGQYRTTTQERFVDHWGRLLYTIAQNIRLTRVSDDKFEGTVDFLDSRGCSFKNLPVSAEVQNHYVIGVLMTVPRYKFATVSRAGQLLRTECRVLEYVEVPVQLNRY